MSSTTDAESGEGISKACQLPIVTLVADGEATAMPQEDRQPINERSLACGGRRPLGAMKGYLSTLRFA